MGTNVSDWREKYLDSLDQRDRLKKQYEHRHELLRKALLRLSRVAVGQHEKLDRELENLRASISNDGQLTLAVDSLEETLLQLDRDEDNKCRRPQPSLGECSKSERGPVVSGPDVSPSPFAEEDARVETILLACLDHIEVAECIQHKALNARKRLQNGISWSELVPTLEDIRDLLLQSCLRAGEEHRHYLLRMHQQLEEVVASIGGVASSYHQQTAADGQLEQQLHQQMDSMGHSLKQASDLDVLKQDIDGHLQLIQQAMEKRQKIREEAKDRDKLDILTLRLKQVEEEAKSVKEELETQKFKATTDALTGLANREAYNQHAHAEWNRKQRFGHALAVVVCDIDKFKLINDRFGHQAGDRVLQVLAKTISQRLRGGDFIARYGGEEFVILLPETSAEGGWQLMDRIRAAISKAPFRFKQEPLQVTLSMGIVEVREDEAIVEAFERADKVLYRAKEEGRNRCLQEQ